MIDLADQNMLERQRDYIESTDTPEMAVLRHELWLKRRNDIADSGLRIAGMARALLWLYRQGGYDLRNTFVELEAELAEHDRLLGRGGELRLQKITSERGTE